MAISFIGSVIFLRFSSLLGTKWPRITRVTAYGTKEKREKLISLETIDGFSNEEP